MKFVRNAWYAALWAERLKPDEPQERVILGEPIVIYRASGGALTALHNRCPHRSAPLHMGKVCANGNIQCGYHGLQFDRSGACVVNPHGKGVIPVAARVSAYPVAERHSLIWVWLGDREADPNAIPDLSVIDIPAQQHVTYRDVLDMDARYELVIDNLLDLSHTAYLHRGVLGNDDTVAAEMKVTQEGETVTVSRWMPGVRAPGLFDIMFKRDGGEVDHWSSIKWIAPGCLINDSGVTARGSSRAEGTGIYGLHILTPVSERKTMYHFAAVRQNPVPFPEDIRQDIMMQLKDLRRKAFTTEDEPMIEAQQRMLDIAGPDVKPVLLEVDGGTVRYKRVLEQMLNRD